ncbi:MAG: helix-turn-helix domain-containing protein [Treponema sp.]|nr:helix-turn-helix domain-containing protein [Treponema sp.]
MSELSIIRRRELDPLLLKALEILKFYEKATDCLISVLGPDCRMVEQSKHPKAMLFCTLCKKYSRDSGKNWAPEEYPCTGMHLNAIREAQRVGGSYIYTCRMGFIFWTSPIYSGQRFAGALMSSGILAIKRQQAVEHVYQLCRGDITREEVERYLESIPEKTYDNVKALAQMMLICAEQISGTNEETSSMINRITRQEARISDQIHMIKESRSNGKVNPGYLLEKERLLLACLRRGDNEAGRKILGELLDILCVTSPGNFAFFKFRAMELVVVLSRAAINPENTRDNAVLEANNRYLKKIEDTQSIKELTETLHVIVDRMSGKIFSFQGIRHSSALRKAERFIWENYTRKISLQEIAEASGLSAPYFSTIFKDEMGENLSNYLNRLRVEKAAAMLAETELTLNEIAAACGFEDQSWFSKIFKNFTGSSPGKYRERGGNYIAPLTGGDLSQIDV